MNEPLVTVITPTYNRASFLAETINSVLSQDYPSVEYLVLDDGSRDDTLSVLEQYKGRLTAISHPNMGETRTVNKGLGLARGEIITVVNSDDPMRPGAIRESVQALLDHPEALLAYPDWDEIDEHGAILKTLRLPDYDIHRMMREFNIAMGPGVFLRRRALDVVGVRNENIRYGGDVDLWIRMALAGPFVHIPQVLATHRVHSAAASSSGRGWRMSREVSQFAHNALNNPAIPRELAHDRHHILSTAHVVATHYCGQNWWARLHHSSRAAYHGVASLALDVRRGKLHLGKAILTGLTEPFRIAGNRLINLAYRLSCKTFSKTRRQSIKKLLPKGVLRILRSPDAS